MRTEHELGEIGQIALPVADLDRAVAFYRDALRLPLLFQAPPGLAFFDCKGVRLMLSRPEEAGRQAEPASSVIYFRVGDLKGTYAELLERNVSFVDEPHMIARMPDHELWMTFFHDSEGNLLALMSEVR